MSKKEDLDVRPGVLFRNYDYGGPEDGGGVGPGRGLYNGKMDKYKSTKEFIEKARKRRRKALSVVAAVIDSKLEEEYLDEIIKELVS